MDGPGKVERYGVLHLWLANGATIHACLYKSTQITTVMPKGWMAIFAIRTIYLLGIHQSEDFQSKSD
jgi:hypothetical protein